ncbi:MAG: hypothetical protein AB7P23_07855 [Amphiplicatus sp.]
MGRLARALLRDPLFLAGLAIRLALIALVVPSIHRDWFAPFLRAVLRSDSPDIWSSFLAAGGDILAFPYGLPYIAVFGPPIWLVDLFARLGAPALASGAAASIALRASLLALDVMLLVVLTRWTGRRADMVRFYWLSPIVVFVLYWYGQLDILPTLLLIGAIIAVVNGAMRTGGALLAVACAAKLSMLAAAPIFLIFIFRNRLRREGLFAFCAAGAALFALLMAPILASAGARAMILGTREAEKIYDLAIQMGDARIFVAPVAYAMIAYLFWNIRRIPSPLFVNIVGIGFVPILLLTPASPGWFMWLAPFLALHQTRNGRSAIVLTLIFSALVVLTNALTIPAPQTYGGASLSGEALFSALSLGAAKGALLGDWLWTGMTAAGLLLAGQMLRDGLLRTAHYRLGRRRFLIGVAGDSGSGKDTLVAAITDLFGARSVVHVSGDDYHVWDRRGPMWSALTHLNPAANRLHDMARDTLRLGAGAAIQSRHYDHATGLLSRPRRIASNDVVLVSGLHALLPPDLRARLDLRIFLDMDEDLRRVLKIARDTMERGHSESKIIESLERRRPDRERYILPQRNHADLVFSLCAASPLELARARAGAPFHMRLTVLFDEGLPYDELIRHLLCVGTASIDAVVETGGSRVGLVISGWIGAEDVRSLSKRFVPDIENYIELTEQWRDGWLGIMQLFIVLMLINRFRRKTA